MHVIRARNVHQAMPEAIRTIRLAGIPAESRNGPVLVHPEPVATVYERAAEEKVEFWSLRDSNPYFHLFEAMWMLAGRNDVAFPAQFNSTFGQFSDDGQTFNAAYGHRWRKHFERDQLVMIADALKKDPTDRRQVLSMHDPWHDPVIKGSKDLPCNTHVYFSRHRGGVLDMMVCCRSNDIVWGCYGSNAVHFGFLLEYMAARIGCPVGRYCQLSNNWHGYRKTLDPLLPLEEHAALSSKNSMSHVDWCPYRDHDLRSQPLIDSDRTTAEIFDADLDIFLDNGLVLGIHTPFIRHVLQPLYDSYEFFSDRTDGQRFVKARNAALACQAEDWKLACMNWLDRRERRAMEKQQNVE